MRNDENIHLRHTKIPIIEKKYMKPHLFDRMGCLALSREARSCSCSYFRYFSSLEMYVLKYATAIVNKTIRVTFRTSLSGLSTASCSICRDKNSQRTERRVLQSREMRKEHIRKEHGKRTWQPCCEYLFL